MCDVSQGAAGVTMNELDVQALAALLHPQQTEDTDDNDYKPQKSK